MSGTSSAEVFERRLFDPLRSFDGPAILGPGRDDWPGILRRVDATVARLRAAGLREDMRVGIDLEPSPAYDVLLLAVLRSGAKALMLRPSWTVPEVDRCLELVRPSFLVTHGAVPGSAAPHEASTTYVGAIESAEAFGRRLYAEAVRRGAARAARVTVLGDGAVWIWGLAEEHVPGATQIVDLYHAREHVAELGKLLYGPGSGEATRWTAARTADLDAGEVERLVAALDRLRPRAAEGQEAIRKAVGYFQANAERMRYASFRRQGLFVDSGVVEAGSRLSLGSGSSNPACAGRSKGPMPSSPCAVLSLAAAGRSSGRPARSPRTHIGCRPRARVARPVDPSGYGAACLMRVCAGRPHSAPHDVTTSHRGFGSEEHYESLDSISFTQGAPGGAPQWTSLRVRGGARKAVWCRTEWPA